MAKITKETKSKSTIKQKVSKKSQKAKSPENSYKTSEGKRVRRTPKHQSFRLSRSKVIKKNTRPMPGFLHLLRGSWQLIYRNKRTFGALALIYAVLLFVFIKAFGLEFSLSDAKSSLNEYFGDSISNVDKSLGLFYELLQSSGTSSDPSAGVYQFFLSVFLILATIYIVRKLLAGDKVSVKEAFYNGMYPIIPFFLVLLVLVVQLIPAYFGNLVLATVLNNGLAVTALESVFWYVLYGLLVLLSLYMITSSMFALMIVTLHDVTPMQALRSARELVLHRRFKIWLRILLLPLVLLVVMSVIFMPLVVILPVLAEALFLFVGSLAIIFSTVYFYNLYRQLL